MERSLTCIICPRGCALRVTLDAQGRPTSVEGNACPRGEDYAISECTAPMRTVTTTARCEGGYVIPVKTASSVPKEKVAEVMAEINATLVKDGLGIGDTVIENVDGTGVRVVITGKRP